MDQLRESAAYRHSSRNDRPVTTAMIGHTIPELIWNMLKSESRNTAPAIRKSGPVIPQCSVLFLTQLTPQPKATAKQIVAAEEAWRGCQYTPIRLRTPQPLTDAKHQ